MSATLESVILAHRHSSKHRDEIEASSLCGCFYCLSIFAASEITEWVDWPADVPEDLELSLGITALCPKCGIDSVIGDKSGFPVTTDFLAAMERHWFSGI